MSFEAWQIQSQGKRVHHLHLTTIHKHSDFKTNKGNHLTDYDLIDPIRKAVSDDPIQRMQSPLIKKSAPAVGIYKS